MNSLVILLCLFALTLGAPKASGHGFLQRPKSRNLIAHLEGREYCHHCLTSGGPTAVQGQSPGRKYPTTETAASAVRHTMCGESATILPGTRVYNPYPPPVSSTLPVYRSGQTIDIEVGITLNIKGHFEFRLCDVAKLSNPSSVNWGCMTTLLKRVPVANEVSPVDVNYPERYYLEPECAPNYNKTIRMKYKLPDGLTCERCVMQWWWVSANTCNPPGYHTRSPQPKHVGQGCGWYKPNQPACEVTYPEEHWNCADLRILASLPSGTPRPATPAPSPVKQPSKPPTSPPPPPPAPRAPPKPIPAPAPKPTPPPPPKNCAILNAQCGGAGWNGPTCCQQGVCYSYIATYSQCRNDGCPAGWLCSKNADVSLMTSAVEWGKQYLEL